MKLCLYIHLLNCQKLDNAFSTKNIAVYLILNTKLFRRERGRHWILERLVLRIKDGNSGLGIETNNQGGNLQDHRINFINNFAD